MATSRLKVILAERGETQKHLATATGLAYGTINLVANGRVAPWPKIRRTLADYLGEDPFETDAADRLVAQAVEQGFGETVTDTAVLRTVSGIARRAGDRS
jgi:transcriptional regulator with XRE-family HTH domain